MASQVQAPISNENEMVESLVRRYKEIPEMLKGFFGELSGLISYLKANQDIDEERVVFLEELIRRANEYLVEKCDVIKAFKQIYGVTHTLQIVLYKYLDSALLNNHPIPAPLQTRFQRIAESMREFISFLTDVAKYYLAVGNPPLDVRAGLMDLIGYIEQDFRDGHIDLGVDIALTVMEIMIPVMAELRSQCLPTTNSGEYQ